MATQWYCRLMGTEMGPFSSKELLEMARSHKITPDDAVKKGEDGNWVDAHRVKGLFEDLSASTIITASLPPDVQRELDKRRAQAEAEADAKAADEKAAKQKAQPATVTWNYISDESKVGPLTFNELVYHCKQGKLKPHNRVWSSKSPKWKQAKDVAGLEFD